MKEVPYAASMHITFIAVVWVHEFIYRDVRTFSDIQI